MKKIAYDKDGKGIIKDIKYANHSRILIVEYKVDGKTYELKEKELNKPYKIIKLGFIPIGYKCKPLIEIKSGIQVMVGSEVKIKYCASNPSKAFLIDNVGKINWY